MDSTQWIVTAIGIALMVAIALYFFLKHDSVVIVATASQGVQEQSILVKGGYHPADIQLKKDIPVRLVFNRQESTSCSEEVVIPEFGIKRTLTAFAETVVEFTPTKSGTYEFMCGMNMLHGSLIVT